MSEEMLSCTKQKFKELIANAKTTFQKRRGAKHGAQLWQKHHSEAKEFMSNITQKGKYTSILDRFQNDEVFHASQRQHNCTEEWCKYLDYVRTIDITHRAPPEQRERYDALYHFRYHPKFMERGPMKSRPDYHETTRAIKGANRRHMSMANTSGIAEVALAFKKVRLARSSLPNRSQTLCGAEKPS